MWFPTLCLLRKRQVSSTIEAEIEAMQHAIYIVQKSKFTSNRVVICSDCISAIEQVRMGLSASAPLQGCMRSPLNSLGNTYFVHYVPREINRKADFLAKKGLNKSNIFSY